MANEKDKNRNLYRPIKNPELLNQNKDTQQERLSRGSRGNPSSEDWAAFLDKQGKREELEKKNSGAKQVDRKEKADHLKQNDITKQNQKDHDKDR